MTNRELAIDIYNRLNRWSYGALNDFAVGIIEDELDEAYPESAELSLLPCPFCGAEAVFVEMEYGYMVRCTSDARDQLDYIGSKEELLKTWNRRVEYKKEE